MNCTWWCTFKHCPAGPFEFVIARRLFAKFSLLEHLQVYPCSVFALRTLYTVQGPAPERNSSLTLSMQLVELCKASGRGGSGGGCYGLQDYFSIAPWRSNAAKTFQGKALKAAAK
jgi:hypothetical protein